MKQYELHNITSACMRSLTALSLRYLSGPSPSSSHEAGVIQSIRILT